MTTDDRFNIAIFGIGAMGCLFASRLDDLAAKNSELRVYLVGHWPEQLVALRRGLKVRHCDGTQSRHSLQVTNNPAELPPVDLALLLVKSYQTGSAVREAAAALSAGGVALTLQNGLGNFGLLRDAVGENRAAFGVASYGATLLKPGKLQCGGEGEIFLAKLPHLSGPLNRAATLLNQANLKTEISANTDGILWLKLAVNAAINPLSALLEVPNGELLATPERRATLFAAAAEVFRVAKAQGITLPVDAPNAWLEQVCRATADNRSSMLQDILRGRPTEIDSICGAVVKLGAQLNIPTPVNARLWRQVKAKEEKIRG